MSHPRSVGTEPEPFDKRLGMFRLYVESTGADGAGGQPGFLAVLTEDGPAIPVFSSEWQLAQFRGAVRWFSATGADLLNLMPIGYDLILDPAGPNPIRLHQDMASSERGPG